jgi:DNA-binding NarL/FixJ family response regulator
VSSVGVSAAIVAEAGGAIAGSLAPIGSLFTRSLSAVDKEKQMQILLITSDNLLRDQVKVGLQQFPETQVTCGESFPGVNLLRTVDFELVFVQLGDNPQDALVLVHHLRSFDQTTELIAIGDERIVKDLSREKQKHGISGFLTDPLDVTDFFRLIARMRSRCGDREPLPAR